MLGCSVEYGGKAEKDHPSAHAFLGGTVAIRLNPVWGNIIFHTVGLGGSIGLAVLSNSLLLGGQAETTEKWVCLGSAIKCYTSTVTPLGQALGFWGTTAMIAAMFIFGVWLWTVMANSKSQQQRCIDELRAQRRRWLGAQFPDLGHVDPAVHAELRSANERLMSEKAGLANTIVDLRRTVNALEYDLAAAREALARELAEPDRKRLTPLPLRDE